jgi:uncharacterized protein YukE
LVVDLLEKCKSAGWIKESVLKEDRPSRTISPNDLADERFSRLVKIEGVVERAALPEPRTYPSGENYDDAINAISRAGTAISENLTQTRTVNKMTDNLSDLLNAQSGEFAMAAAAMRKGLGLRLLVSEDDPDIEDVPGRPDLLRAQKGALELGVNPGWQRLEGLASLFQHRIEQCSEAMHRCPQILTNFMVGLSQIPRSKRSVVIRQNTKWLANMVSILEICRMPLDFMTEVQSDFMRGFSTDGIWIDFIKKAATSYTNIAAAFVEFLVAFENEWNKLEHLPLWSRHVAKAHAKQMQKLKAVVNDTAESVRRFANDVEKTSAPKPTQIAS